MNNLYNFLAKLPSSDEEYCLTLIDLTDKEKVVIVYSRKTAG